MALNLHLHPLTPQSARDFQCCLLGWTGDGARPDRDELVSCPGDYTEHIFMQRVRVGAANKMHRSFPFGQLMVRMTAMSSEHFRRL